jgi:hypothetical protein
MIEQNVPKRLWDYGLVYIAEILAITARRGSNQRPGLEESMGQTVDISEWLDFEFYDPVWYWDEKKSDMTEEQGKVGRWLGIAHRIGSDMTYWILTKGGKVIAWSTVQQHITIMDMAQDAVKASVHAFEAAVLERLDDAAHINDEPGIFYMDNDDEIAKDNENVPTDEEYGDMLHEPKPNIDDVEIYD